MSRPQKQRRPRNAIDGWLVLDKPYGLTSNRSEEHTSELQSL